MILSARMMSEPWVSTTLPSNVAVFCASSAVRRSDSMFTGLSRSLRSANAGADASTHAARASAAGLLPRRCIVSASDLGLERELLLGLVEDHADPRQGRLPVRDCDRLIGPKYSLSREHVKIFGARAKLRLLRRGFAEDHDVAVQECLLALAVYRSAIGGRNEIAALLGDLHHSGIQGLARVVVREVPHLRRRERVLKLAVGVQILDGEILDDGVGLVHRGPRFATRALADGVLQPQREQPEKSHQGQRQQRRDARLHASWRATACSSVFWARMMASQISRTAPCPPGARVT